LRIKKRKKGDVGGAWGEVCQRKRAASGPLKKKPKKEPAQKKPQTGCVWGGGKFNLTHWTATKAKKWARLRKPRAHQSGGGGKRIVTEGPVRVLGGKGTAPQK